jgi:hypothetical protein
MLTDLRERLKGVGRLDIQTAVNLQALRYYGRQRELGRLPAESLVRRARVLLAVGEDQLDRDHYRAALAAFREAHRTTAEQLARAPDDPDRIFAHSQSEYWIGFVDYRRRNLAPARLAWQRYKALADRLVASDANNPRWVREAGYADGNLCTIAVEAPADPAAALRICASALARMRQARRLAGPQPGLMLDLANRHAWIADAWRLNGRWDRVLFHRRQQEALARWLLGRDPRNLDYQDFWMRTQFRFGELLEEHRERAEARRWFAGAAATAAMLRARDPENTNWRSFQQRIAEAMN